MTTIDDENPTPPGYWFAEIDARLHDRMRAELNEFGLRRSGWRILHLLADGPATTDELTERLPRGRRRRRAREDARGQTTGRERGQGRGTGWTRWPGAPGPRWWAHGPNPWMFPAHEHGSQEWPHGPHAHGPQAGSEGHDDAHRHPDPGPHDRPSHEHHGHPAEHAFERGFVRGFERGMWMPFPASGFATAGRPPFLWRRTGFVERVLAGFVERGWVWFDGDRATLTEEGRAAHDTAFERVKSVRQAAVAGIDPEAYATTLATLEAMARNLGWRPQNESEKTGAHEEDDEDEDE